MISIVFKVYEIIQILLLKLIKIPSFFSKSQKLKRFATLRDPKHFLAIVLQTGIRFQALKKENPGLKLFWVHVASAGELEQAIPIARTFHEHLNVCFFVTYYSPSTEPFLKNFQGCIGSAGLPVDVRKVYQKAYQVLPFEKIFFVRYDIWPALVFFANRNSIELNLLCATRQRTTSGLRSSLSQKWNWHLYKKFAHIFTTTEQDESFFRANLPNQKIIFAGDTKWARAHERAQEFRDLLLSRGSAVSSRGLTVSSRGLAVSSRGLAVSSRGLAVSSRGSTAGSRDFLKFFHTVQQHIRQNSLKSIVFGSPHAAEHEIALKCIGLGMSLLVIYVPHDVSAKSCASLHEEIRKCGGSPYFYSEIVKEENHWIPRSSRGMTSQDSDFTAQSRGADVLIVDSIGHLAEIYALGDIAVVGGGFDGKIHNVLEPSAHGVPLLIGSQLTRASEAERLVQEQAAKAFDEPNLLFQFLARWVTLNENMKPLKIARERALELFQNTPNTNKIILDIFLQETGYDNKTIDH